MAWLQVDAVPLLHETKIGWGGHMVGPEQLAVETGGLPIRRAPVGSLQPSSCWLFEDRRTFPALKQTSSLHSDNYGLSLRASANRAADAVDEFWVVKPCLVFVATHFLL